MATTMMEDRHQAAPSSFIADIASKLKMPRNSNYRDVINKMAVVPKAEWEYNTYAAHSGMHDSNEGDNVITIMSHNARGLKGKMYSEHIAELRIVGVRAYA